MALVRDIIQSEIVFPRRFARVEERDYGLLYHTAEIPDSHDGNHAHILRRRDCAAAISDMEDFYRSRGLLPRVYHAGMPGSGRALRAALQAEGFQFYSQASQFYVHARPSRIVPCAELTIRRIQSALPELMAMIESGSQRQMKVVRRSLACPDFHLLVGFLKDRPVTMAAVERAGAVARVDSVLTHEPHRGKGYSRAVIHELVRYHKRVLGGALCLYTDNPTAARIYEEAGFEKLAAPLEFWSAWKD
jgi:GNAT superfamily N-acetyltransferase